MLTKKAAGMFGPGKSAGFQDALKPKMRAGGAVVRIEASGGHPGEAGLR